MAFKSVIRFTSFVMILFACIQNPASAVIIGDKNWMQVTATEGHLWTEYDAIFDMSTGQCDAGECLLGGSGGIDLSSYTMASASDVLDMAHTLLGPHIDDTQYAYDTGTFDELFWPMFEGYPIIIGFTRTVIPDGIIVRFVDGGDEEPFNKDWVLVDNEFPHTPHGAWLYKAVVPVPAAVWLFGSGLIGLIGVARRKKA